MLIKYIRLISRVCRWPFYMLRGNRYNILYSSIGKRTFLRNTIIDKYAYIGNDCVLNDAIVGSYSCIADGVQIGGMEHPYWDFSISPLLTNQYIFGKQTIIGHDVWIAAGCIIKQGVKIGNGAVVGANSFVTKDVPPYAIVFGTPAVIHKFRFQKEIINKIEMSKYWSLSPDMAKKVLEMIKEETNE